MAGAVHGVGPRDADLVLRDGTTNLTADETLTKTLSGGVKHTNPLGVYVLVPQASGTDTLKVTAKFTDTGKKVEVTHTDNHVSGTDGVPVVYCLPLPPTAAESLSVVLDVTDTGGGVNFGAVQVWLARAMFPIVPDGS